MDLGFNPIDIGFALGANATVNTTVLQPDGKIIVGGGFTTYNGTACNYIARLNSDGSLDAAFTPGTGPNAAIHTAALQPDGKIIIGGFFTTYNGITRNYIARLNSDGSLDASFNPGSGANNLVITTSIQPDGKIIIGGYFTTYNGLARSRIARLNSDGSLDAAFTLGTGANAIVWTTVLQPDGKIIVGGGFTTYNGMARNYIARLNSDGSLDAAFTPGTGPNTSISTAALQPDGKIIIGGAFTTYNGTARNYIARINADGSLDGSFNPGSGANGTIATMTIQPDGNIIIGGNFTTYSGLAHSRIARLDPYGSPDAAFNSGTGASTTLTTTAVQPDGRIIIGGAFTSYNGAARSRFTRLNTDGSLDATFGPSTGADNTVYAARVRPDGKIIIGGAFTTYNGTARISIARLNTDGSLDASFDPGTGPNNSLNAVVMQPDGKVFCGGDFTTFNGTARNRIMRLNPDGSLDASFDPGIGPNTSVFSAALQPDGKLIIGGDFNTFNGLARSRVARLNSDGTLDAFFNPGSGANSRITTGTLQPDGKVIIVGLFTTFNGTARNHIARLNADGSLDASFNPGTGADSTVITSVLQPDGKIIIGGWFTSYNGTGRNHIARLNADGSLDASFNPGTGADNSVSTAVLQPDGKIIIGGYFTTYNGAARNHIARLNSNGSLDATFNPASGANSRVSTIALQPDGNVIIGGSFTAYNGIGRNHVTRLNGSARAGIKLMLEGPYSGTSMNDALRSLPSFPLTEPFTVMGYAETGFTSGVTIGSSVLTTTGNNAIVDWVLVEMRPVSTPGTVAASRAVLLQRDGDVVDLDGVSTVGFAGLAPGNYCVAVKPRNHLPVMLSTTTPVSYGSSGIATVDFTLPATQVYDNDARKNVSGVMVLAAGDGSFNETVRYTGSGNDRDPILIRVGSTTPNNTVSGYWREDLNMDGTVKYTGSANDRDIILTNVGSTTPNNTRGATLP